jgi:hypothetical protein
MPIPAGFWRFRDRREAASCDSSRHEPGKTSADPAKSSSILRERQLVRVTVLQGGNRVFHLDRPAFFWICDDCSRIRTFSSEEVTETLRLFAETKGFIRSKLPSKSTLPAANCDERLLYPR